MKKYRLTTINRDGHIIHQIFENDFVIFESLIVESACEKYSELIQCYYK